MDNKELIEKLILFKNKAFCHHSHYRAGQIWRKVSKYIPSPYHQKIATEWEHVYLDHDFKQACMALNAEINNFILMIK